MPSLPNDDTTVRLVGALRLECKDEWAVQRARCMTLETIAPMKDALVIRLPAMASRPGSPAPSNAVTISASDTTSRDSIPLCLRRSALRRSVVGSDCFLRLGNLATRVADWVRMRVRSGGTVAAGSGR